MERSRDDTHTTSKENIEEVRTLKLEIARLSLAHVKYINDLGVRILQRTNRIMEEGGSVADVQQSLSELHNLFQRC